MLNSVVVVGRICEKPTLIELESGRKNCSIVLSVNRAYKNSNGDYETDYIPCLLWQGIAQNVVDYCKQGDIIGIRGKIENRDNKLQVVAEKVTFLSSKKVEGEED